LAADGARLVLIGADDERALAEEVVEAMTAPAENLTGRTSLPSLVGVLARAAVCVANDSGPRHVAEAVGTATIGIYWCGNLVNASPLTRAHHRPVISWQLLCPECGINCMSISYRCPHNPSFVRDVPVDEVIHEARDVLHMVLERSSNGNRPADGTDQCGGEP
jgi:ADP-heptose:LPS heptosyltransferase